MRNLILFFYENCVSDFQRKKLVKFEFFVFTKIRKHLKYLFIDILVKNVLFKYPKHKYNNIYFNSKNMWPTENKTLQILFNYCKQNVNLTINRLYPLWISESRFFCLYIKCTWIWENSKKLQSGKWLRRIF